MGVKHLLLKLICFLFFISGVQAQISHDFKIPFIKSNPADSFKNEGFSKEYNKKVLNNLEDYKQNRLALAQKRKLNELELFEERLSDFLNYDLDTFDIYEEILHAGVGYENALKGVQDSIFSFNSYRDLAASQSSLIEIQQSLERTKLELNHRMSVLVSYQTEFDSLVSDTSIFIVPTKLSGFETVMNGYMKINEKLIRDFTLLMESNEKLQKLKDEVIKTSERINFSLIEIAQKRKYNSRHMLDRELPNIWQLSEIAQPFSQVINNAIQKESALLFYHIQNNSFMLWLLIILIIAGSYFLNQFVRNIQKNGTSQMFIANPVFRFPGLSILFFCLLISQLIFFNSPFVFQGTLWVLSWVTVLLFIIKKQTPFYGNKVFLLLLLLFPLVFIDNVLLFPFPFESWVLLLICVSVLVLVFYDWKIYKHGRQSKKAYLFIITFFVVMELFAGFCIVFGRFNFGKTFVVSGYIGIMASQFFFWAKDVWNYMLEIVISGMGDKEQNRIYLNLRKLSNQSDSFVNFLVYIAIILVFFRHFFLFNVLIDQIIIQVKLVRYIGSYSYSLAALLTFFGILITTVTVARLITILFDDRLYANSGNQNKGGLKNWTLIVRLVVLTVGFFLAFAAVGVPMDNLTIIIGSLGLGIGFGLQNIVSHLISGIIIAFERPFEANDLVEWNGMQGRIQEIGLRSSKITHVDGSEVVVPNTDLLNQRLLIWTHSNNLRRLELLIGISYEADLDYVTETLMAILNEIPLVRKYPEPQVLMNQFAGNSVECRILYWIEVQNTLVVRGEVILNIHRVFREKGIVIPYPQLDVHFDKEENKAAPEQEL